MDVIKRCGHCEEEKSITLFAWRNKAKGTKQSWCKSCHKKTDKELYYNGPRKEQVAICNKKSRKRNKEFIDSYKKSRGCSLCGYNKYPSALDFHHTEEKNTWVSQLAKNGYSLKRIQEEIDKCIVLCANCHREHHADIE